MMKSFLILVSIFFVFISCTEKKSTEPDETDDTPLASVIIDANGGKLEYEDLLITIPAGSFNNSTELKVFQDASLNSEFENMLSESYIIDGIPENFNVPIEIKLRSQTPNNGEAVIAIGEEVFSRRSGEVEMNFYFIESNVEGEYVTAAFTPPGIGLSKQNNAAGIRQGTTRIATMSAARISSYTTNQGHFKIDVSGNMISSNALEALGNYFEEAYNYYQGLGFSYAKRTSWPMQVTVKQLPGAYGEYSNSVRGHNYGYIEFDHTGATNAETDPNARITAGHEFFHFV